MARRALRVVPNPRAGWRVITLPGHRDLVPSGERRGHVLVCGACGASLLHVEPRILVRNVYLRCSRCGACNDPTPMDA